jgi:tetratricopeptide (TPR) repeat protein
MSNALVWIAIFVLLQTGSAFGETAPRQLILKIQDQIAAGDLQTAENDLLAALQKYPADGGLFNLRGIIAATRNQWTAAEFDFGRAIRLSPELASAYLNLGHIYEMQGESEPSKIDSAIELYRKLLSRNAGAANVRLQLAKLFEMRGRYKLSLSQLSALPPGERSRSLALSLRSADLLAAGDHTGALKTAADLVHAPDASVEDVCRILPLLSDNDSDRAVLALSADFLRTKDLDGHELDKLGSAYLKLGRLGEARSTFESLASQQPQSVRPLLALGEVAYKQRDLEGALGYLAHARDLAPLNAGIHFFFGVVCIELNLPVEAKKSLQKALDLEPANPDYNYARGSVELQGKAAWDAIPYFKKYVTARPNDARGHFALGVAEFGSKDYQAAAAELERIAHRPETTAGAEYFLGRIAKADSDWPAAAEHFQRSINADPNYAESHAEMAVIKLHLHEMEHARQEIEIARKLNPDGYLVNADLLAVYQWTKDERLTAQRNKLDQLDTERSRQQELMLRTIQVRR